ncbi:hypothetical protein [Streptomyces sp. AJS327]|uniref:hypothetical protein n=1 Tax=Streptomyces sp. AJS327 TaxID=2545265 RepID=UPI001C60CBE5|nr:hypothetical protein [Streptomyces sp. AJS327]
MLLFFRADDPYFSFGLTEKAHFPAEDGAGDRLMASAWFLTALDEATERRIARITRAAAG